MNRLLLAIKVLRQLGFQPIGLFSFYRLGLSNGFYRLIEKGVEEDNRLPEEAFRIQKIFELPSRESLLTCLNASDVEQLRSEADEIVNGKVRLFGGEPVELKLKSNSPLFHWTAYETGKASITGDIKMTWEPARFGWAYTLARAFYLCKESKYAHAFWRLTASFLESNPPYRGAQWMSGQEVALRLIGMTYAAQVFASAEITVPKQVTALGKVISVHARRIPPTMVYARSQNNNHLLSEAAGLITAAMVLPHHPQASRWQRLGWQWFNRGLEEQISDEGVYIQHSANYQRLMLQLALWINLISQYKLKHMKSKETKSNTCRISDTNINHLKEATSWLIELTDVKIGRCVNLGPNDGAYIQPLSVCPYEDYRPVLQACSAIFAQNAQPIFGKGSWDEMSAWYGAKFQENAVQKLHIKDHEAKTPHVLRNPVSESWGYLRIANFSNRPGHADQLHFDLWRQGINIAQDAGTFSYNDPIPWDNSLAKSEIHNTITVNNMDQMTRAGKFLWLDWATARMINLKYGADGFLDLVIAEHEGYGHFGVIHRRSVSSQSDGSWLIEDQLNPSPLIEPVKTNTYRLHWLFCNAPWEWEDGSLILFTKKGICTIDIHTDKPVAQYQLVRGGELLAGEGKISPTWGWVSPTYRKREPALSLSVVVNANLPVQFSTRIRFHNY